MARARNIKPGFFRNEDLAALPAMTRLLFIGLWTIADREGRLENRPQRIRADIFPYELVDIPQGLGELAKHGFLKLYRVDGKDYIEIQKWAKHQNPHHQETESVIPSSHLGEITSESIPNSTGTYRADSLIPDSLNTDSASSPPAMPAKIPAIQLPTVNGVFDVSFEFAKEMKKAYPAVDVPQQFREMRAWLVANQVRRKTSRGMPTFINNWLAKEQDKGGGNHGGNGTSKTQQRADNIASSGAKALRLLGVTSAGAEDVRDGVGRVPAGDVAEAGECGVVTGRSPPSD